LIVCLSIVTIIATIFFDPALAGICVRNLVIATVAIILARQIQTLDAFLYSHHCRGISKKTASSLIKRSYMLTITSLACFIALGFIVQPGEALSRAGERIILIPEFTRRKSEEVHDYIIPDLIPEDDDREVLIGEEGEEHAILQDDEPVTSDEEISVIFWLSAAAAAIVALFIMMVLIKYRRLENQFEDYDDVTEEAPANLEKMSKKQGTIFNFGINHTIRRLFRRKVKEYMVTKGMYTQKSDTPKKLAETIGEWEDIGVLEQLYHKARYSGENVKRDELNMLKKQG
jgi:hypothetical protein